MTPRLDIVLDAPPRGDVAGLAPKGRRHRLVLAWPGAARHLPLDLIEAARGAGFERIRLRAPAPELDLVNIARAVARGLNELECLMPGPVPLDGLRALRESGRLLHLVLTSPSPIPGTGLFDEFVLQAHGPIPGPVPDGYRRVGVRGAPLCLAEGLSPTRVIANAFVASGPGPRLELRSEEPRRAYFAPCAKCALVLACDGLPYSAFASRTTRRVTLKAFESGVVLEVPLRPEGLLLRQHYPTVLSHRVHLAAVAARVRPCGRSVVSPKRAAQEAALVRRLGMHPVIVPAPEAPPDLDVGAGTPGQTHIFFSRDPDLAHRAAALERDLVAGRISFEGFSRRMGELLGYPECCVNAFVSAGRLASTAELWRLAHARSQDFFPELSCFDPLSPVTLVPHIPCRFDCKASLDLAHKVLRLVPMVQPFLDAAAMQLLARDAFLFPDGGVVLWDGEHADSPFMRPGLRLPDSVSSAILAMLDRGPAGIAGQALLFPFRGRPS